MLSSRLTIARLSLAVVGATLLVSALARAAASLEVPLVVEEAAGVARSAFPARGSVPLPRGRVRAPDGVWLQAADGRRVLAQAQALERWPDGSVRWLLLDFLADVPAGGRATYRLRDGRPPRPAGGPTVRLTAARGARVLDSGTLRVRVPDRGDVLVAELAAGAVALPDALGFPVLQVDGTSQRAGPARVTVETRGPVRTELLLAGRYPNGLAYEARLAVFAGQPWLRLQHTVTNLADPHYMPVRSLTLAVPGRFAHGAVGVDGGLRSLAALEPPHLLEQRVAQPALLDGAPAGAHGDGWARAIGERLAVTLVAAAFWEEWPKALRLAPATLSLDLFAGATEPVRLGTGAAKTHELWVAVEPAADAGLPDMLARALRAPLLAEPSPAWTAASRALPNAIAPDGPGARDFLARLASAHAGYREQVKAERWDDGPPVPCAERTSENPRVGLYGLLNWGDWQFPGYRDRARDCDGWGNLEYDLTQVLALAWAATGSRAFHDGLVPAARHYRDVDIIHHWPGHPERVGLNHPHKAAHFALEARGSVDLGHTWAEGLVSFWRLTGETRALAAARRLADALGPRVERARNPRQFGWPMLALVAVYDATRERRYLDAARAYAARALALHQPTPAAGDWKMGILADGLAAVHEHTRDDALRRWLVAYADALLADRGRFSDPRLALPLGYLAALTGEERYRTAALDVVRGLRIGRWGKTLAAGGRTGFRLLAPLHDGLSRPRAPVPRPPAPVRRERPRGKVPPPRGPRR